jgi:hypothetical protein
MITNGGQLLQGMYLIDLDVRIPWGVRKGKPEDVGLSQDKMPEEVFRLAKRFIPRNWLKEHVYIAGQAGKAINRVASPVTFPIGKARLVPVKALPDLLNRLQQLQADFNERTDLRLNDGAYEQMREDMLERHPEFRSVLMGCFLPVEVMRDRFSLTWQVFELAMPKGGQAKQISDAKAKALAEALEQEAAKAKAQVSTFFEAHRRTICEETLKACQRVSERIAQGRIINEGTLKQISKKTEWFARMLEIGPGVGTEQVQWAVSQLRYATKTTEAKAVRNNTQSAEEFKEALKKAGEELSKITDIEVSAGQYGRRLVR